MKKFGKKISIVLVMMMIFTSFEFVGVFAETAEGEAPSVTEGSVTEEVAAPAEEDAAIENAEATPSEDTTLQTDADSSTDDTEEPPEEPEETLKIEDLQLLAGYNCVVLRWKKADIEGVEYTVTDADTGELVASGNDIEDYEYMEGRLEGDYLMCKISQPVSTDASLPEYQYVLHAKVGDKPEVTETSNRRAPVRTIAYRFTVKKGSKLKRHGGSASGPRTYNLRKGQTLICYGFGGGGCYMFNYKGSIFYCAKIRAKKVTAIYRTNWNYTPEEAELFLNQRGGTSRKSVYLWCNQYTQHFYYMQGSKGKWRCTDDWECSTGKPTAPTPTGMWGTKTITGKWKKHHNIKWWSKFSGTNSVHGQKKGWTFGRPKSNGCIRNPVAKAEKVYYGAAVGTSLLVF